jgi:hypothetical protein
MKESKKGQALDPEKMRDYEEFDEEGFKDWTARRKKKAQDLRRKPEPKEKPAGDMKGWW